jgi:hypothetical protein
LRLAAGSGVAIAAASAGSSLRHALAIGERPVGIARLQVPSLPDPRPGAFVDLLREVQDNSSIRPDLQVPDVDPSSESLFGQPFVALSGDRHFEPLSEEAVGNLRLYLRQGGFLFVDDASGLEDSDFERAVRRDLSRILPGSPLGPLGRDHVIYRSFFLLSGISGRLLVRPYLSGIWLGDVTPVLVSHNDLCGAWLRSAGGSWALDVSPGGGRQRIEARKLGVNLVLFALSDNYKRDAVHVKTLLKRMRQQGGWDE